jgi:hypothetical protein
MKTLGLDAGGPGLASGRPVLTVKAAPGRPGLRSEGAYGEAAAGTPISIWVDLGMAVLPPGGPIVRQAAA